LQYPTVSVILEWTYYNATPGYGFKPPGWRRGASSEQKDVPLWGWTNSSPISRQSSVHGSGGHAARYEANIEPLWASFAASGSHFSQNSPSVTERSAPLF
jgi:hypothetical protein